MGLWRFICHCLYSYLDLATPMGNLKFARPQMGNAIILKKMKLKFIKKIIVMSGILSIPGLLYHGIIDKPDGANILLENFKDQMFALKKAGWQTISIEDFYAFTRGEKQVPDKSFLLTFDDGRKDSYYPVDPILKALDYNAVIFVISKYSLGQSSNYYL